MQILAKCRLPLVSIVASLLTLMISLVGQGQPLREQVIYGSDDRQDINQVTDLAVLANADAVVSIVSNRVLGNSWGSRDVSLKANVYGAESRLCKEERFYSQPTVPRCSGTLIGDDLVMTASHCFDLVDCSKTSVVFGFRMIDANRAATTIPADEVYACKRIVAAEKVAKAQDYAIIQLDRPVRGHRPVRLSTLPVQATDDLYVLGHPSGLPLKLASTGKVRSIDTGIFVTNTDTYGGNSGSAVFNARTHEVVGILVRGEQDFVLDAARKCHLSKVCTETDCRGEDVTHVSFVLQALAKSLHPFEGLSRFARQEGVSSF